MCKYCRDDGFWLDRIRHEDVKPRPPYSAFDQAAAELRKKVEANEAR